MVSELSLSVRLESGQQDPTFTVTQSAVGSIIVGRLFFPRPDPGELATQLCGS